MTTEFQLQDSEEESKKAQMYQAYESFLEKLREKLRSASKPQSSDDSKPQNYSLADIDTWSKKAKEDETLTFPDHDSAIEFFEARAKENIPFLGFESDEKGLTGNYVFSNGDGQLYQGKLAPDLINKFLDAKEKGNIDMKEFKEHLKSGDSEKIEQFLDESHDSPSPLNSSPSPF